MAFDPTKTRGCCVGNCEHSRDNGGAGCDMCDRVAKLPQPKFKKGALEDDVFALPEGETDVVAAPAPKRAAVPAGAARKAPPAAQTKRRPDKGPQTGSLLDYEPD